MRATLRVLAEASRRGSSIGFIGLGAMGREMAANLVSKTAALAPKAGPKPRFVLLDAHEPSLARFLSENSALHPGVEITTASSAAGVARNCATVVTMLPSSPEVQQCYLEDEVGILSALAETRDEPTLCVDCTTLDAHIARSVCDQVRAMGSEYLDSPVSGGVVGAAAGTLSFMVGGSQSAFQAAQPLYAIMGKRAVYCGGSGNGLAAKIANNLLLGISMLATSEAMLLGTKLGLEPALLADILNTSTGKCWSSEVNNPFPGALPSAAARPPADRDYQGGFLAKLMAKDLRLAIAAADENNIKLPAATLTQTVYNKLADHEEFSNRDFSVVLRWLIEANLGLPGNENAPGAEEAETTA